MERSLLQRLRVTQLTKISCVYYKERYFVTVFKRTRHLICYGQIEFSPRLQLIQYYSFKINFNIILTPNGSLFSGSYSLTWGTRWCSWLRHCTTTWKVAGSNPDGVTGIFQWLNPSGRIVALESYQPLNRNEYQESLLGVKTAGA